MSLIYELTHKKCYQVRSKKVSLTHNACYRKTGADTFNAHCRVCHQNGGNSITPNKPIKGSQKLRDFEAFLAFIRNPASSMPSFSQGTISDKRAKELYEYITSEKGLNLIKPN